MNLITILGPTSSGKSEMAVEVAKYLKSKNCSVVIVSCDSRQVYKELNLLSGKIEGNTIESGNQNIYVYKDIYHYLIDITGLDKVYNLNEYINDYITLINNLKDIQYIILTGGTGLYARSVLQNYQLQLLQNKEVPDNLIDLQKLLNKNNFNNSDWQNYIRLKNYYLKDDKIKKLVYPLYDKKLTFYINLNHDELKSKIITRNSLRIESNILEESLNLILKYGPERILKLGLEARLSVFYWLGLITDKEFEDLLLKQTLKYVKRQISWFKKEKNLINIDNSKQIISYINNLLD
jgi:tRNA dimethylallyltransferase